VSISAKDVKMLRDQTGAGMLDCKNALTEAEGNFEKAVELLRKKGQKIMGNRADRNATEGVVIAIVNEDATKGVSINLSAETDFVAKNEDYIKSATEFANIALANMPADKDTLNALPYKTGMTVAERTTEMAGVIGEKIEIKKYAYLEAVQVVAYIHAGNKVGVLVGLNQQGEAAKEAGKNIAMQITALSPVAIDKDDIPAELIEKERALHTEMTLIEKPGAPEAMLRGIVEGKVQKSLFKEQTLMNQDYVKDSKLSVKEYLRSVDKDLKVTSFTRMNLA
jgi:elongation factor Ts